MTRTLTGLLVQALFALALSSALYAAEGQAPADSEKTRFDYAASLYRQGAHGSAEAEFRNLVAAFPKGEYADDAYYWLGKILAMSGKYEDALAQFKAGLANLPSGDMAPALQFETALYWSLPDNPARDYSRAMAEFIKMPFFHPDSPLVPEALYRAALCQIKTGNYAKAEEELKAFAGRYPASEFAAPALYQLGLAHILDGKPDEALAAFQTVRDTYPTGLYSGKALASIELVMRARERKLKLLYSYGTKGAAPGQLSKPAGVALDTEGGLTVADSGNSRLQRFTAGPEAFTLQTPNLAQPSPEKAQALQRPSGVCVSDKGIIYVSDPGAHRVQAYRPDGKLMGSFGRRGAGPGDLDNPAGLAVDDAGNLYVANRGNRRVDVFDAAGRHVRSIGNAGVSEENLLKGPQGVALDLQGNLLVTDPPADRVYKYGPDGKLVAMYPGASPGHVALDSPEGICVDGVGNIYIVNRGAPSLVMFDRDLKPLIEYKGDSGRKFNAPIAVSVSESGLVFVADQGTNSIFILK